MLEVGSPAFAALRPLPDRILAEYVSLAARFWQLGRFSFGRNDVVSADVIDVFFNAAGTIMQMVRHASGVISF